MTEYTEASETALLEDARTAAKELLDILQFEFHLDPEEIDFAAVEHRFTDVAYKNLL